MICLCWYEEKLDVQTGFEDYLGKVHETWYRRWSDDRGTCDLVIWIGELINLAKDMVNGLPSMQFEKRFCEKCVLDKHVRTSFNSCRTDFSLQLYCYTVDIIRNRKQPLCTQHIWVTWPWPTCQFHLHFSFFFSLSDL